jgi:hypothetical protein
VVSDIKWFLAYKYIFRRKPFKKIYERHFKNSEEIHYDSKNSKPNSEFLNLDFLIYLCEFFWVLKPQDMLKCWKCPL